MKNLIFLFLSIIFFFSSCQKREWNNPFDPECPKELWTPTDFASVQQGNAINLTWVQAEKNISGFRIERKIEGEEAWKEVVSPEKATNSWADQSITGGKLYEYRIVALAGGNESNFATVQIKPLLTATLTTAVPSSITATSAMLGGTITTDGGATVTERGVAFSTSPNPTTSNTKLAIGTGTGSYSNTITGLTANTTYYVRAYAINSKGTAYGNEVNFKTSVVLSIATLTTNAVINYTSNSATLGGNITSDGNAPVTERGVCYSTSPNPTTLNSKIAIGNGTGSFSQAVTGLTANTTYYVRAYAINSQGTAYGNEVNFKTSMIVLSLASLTTSTPTNITSNSATLGGNVTNDGYATVTERGICYSASPNPTTLNAKVAIGNGTGSFSQAVNGLTANTTYYVRAYAINSQGTAYGNELIFNTLELNTVMDIDGNIYHTVTIGTQVWMVENLKTTKYNDGKIINYLTSATSWRGLTTGVYCFYNNDEASYKNIYGVLYNWDAVNSGKLAPSGWHIPNDDEWTTLIYFIGGYDSGGGKLKESGLVHWQSPNTIATNSFGFTALPAGFRSDNGYSDLGRSGCWWSSTKGNFKANSCAVYYNTSRLSRNLDDLDFGFSVRCIKD